MDTADHKTLLEGFEHIVRENEPLAPMTRLGLGGVAEFFAEPTNLDELVRLIRRFRDAGQPIRMFGTGSNLLVRDEGVAGLVILLAAPEFCQIDVSGNSITAGGGVRLSHFVSTAVREGLAGPENLVGVPGTIGGALHVNIDAHGHDIGSWTRAAKVVTRDGDVVQRSAQELNFAYRQSSLSELAVIEAEFQFEREPADELTRRMQKIWIMQKAKQPPLGNRSIYVFKDSGGESASHVIESVGLKGTRVGDVEVSQRDANYFVAGPAATSDDVLRLIDLVKRQVADQLAVELDSGITVW